MGNLNWFTATLLIVLLVFVYRGLHFLYWLFFQGNIRLLFEAPSAEDLELIAKVKAKRQAEKEVRLLKKRKAQAISLENEKRRKERELAESELRLRNEKIRYQREQWARWDSYNKGKR